MRTALIAAVLALTLGACKRSGGGSADTTMRAADTSVNVRRVPDTTIVTHDTTVHTDTTRRTGNMRDSSRGMNPRRP